MQDEFTKYPRVIVLLAGFNGESFIREQIFSILSQKYVKVRLIVSIDISTDKTDAIVASLAHEDKRIEILSPRRSGGAARNFFRLLRDTSIDRCDYLALSDQDDIWLPHKLHRACQVMRQSGAHGYSGDVNAFWPTGKIALIKKSHPQKNWDFLFESPGPGCTFVLSQKLGCALQGFLRTQHSALNSIDYHDWFIYAFARSKFYTWIIDNQVNLLYRQHDSNQLGANQGIRQYWRRLKLINNGWWFNQTRLTTQLIGLDKHPFVAPWISGQRYGFFKLALNAIHCRRHRNAQFILFLYYCRLAVMGVKKSPSL